MVFKGFTDENGNVIPVQGAGTVYNEELNSLALGKDTSAIGQDQLVFGRNNIEDADKVEIVGGGAGNITVTKDGSNAKVGDVLLVKFTRAGDEETLRVSVIGKTLQEANSNTQDTIAFIDNSTSSDTDIPSYVTPLLFCKCIDKSSSIEKYMIVYYDNSHNSISVDLTTYENAGTNKYAFVVGFGLIAAYDVVSINAYINKGNIRTLDWEGNQWNAGDITCDDGHGNTISMRGLLSRIATLEAAVNS